MQKRDARRDRIRHVLAGGLFGLLSVALGLATLSVTFPPRAYRAAVGPVFWIAHMGYMASIVWAVSLFVAGVVLIALWVWAGDLEKAVLAVGRRLGWCDEWRWQLDSGFYRPEERRR